MKFFHKLTIILALAGIGGLTACSDDDSGFLKRNLREMSFSYVESSNTFTIRATGDWYISDVPDSREWTGAYSWVHVDRLSGKGSPDTYQKITVTCDQNVSDERTAAARRTSPSPSNRRTASSNGSPSTTDSGSACRAC